jgi:hypothetical protein
VRCGGDVCRPAGARGGISWQGAGFSAFWVAVLVAAAVNPGYSHVREFMSALAAVPARQVLDHDGGHREPVGRHGRGRDRAGAPAAGPAATVASALLAFVLAAVALLPLGRARRSWPVGLAGLLGLAVIAWMVLAIPSAVAGLVQRGFVLVVFGTPVLLATQRHTE